MVASLLPKGSVVVDPLALYGRSRAEVRALNGAPHRDYAAFCEWWLETEGEPGREPGRALLRVWFSAADRVAFTQLIPGV